MIKDQPMKKLFVFSLLLLIAATVSAQTSIDTTYEELVLHESVGKYANVAGRVVAINDHAIVVQYDTESSYRLHTITVGPRNWAKYFNTHMIQIDDWVEMSCIGVETVGLGPGYTSNKAHMWSLEFLQRPVTIFESPEFRQKRIESWQTKK